jgi:hypothetical protein
MNKKRWIKTIKSYQVNLPNILSQLFVNLAAAWFAIVVVTPGLIPTDTFITSLFRNFFFGIVAIILALILAKER